MCTKIKNYDIIIENNVKGGMKMLTNISLREKIDKYVDEGIYNINCKQYHDEMIETLNNATAEENSSVK